MAEVHNLLCLEQKIRPKTTKLLNPTFKVYLLSSSIPFLCVQVQLREYVFESRHRPAFGEEDIVNMFPVVRHLKPTSSDATQLVQQAQLAVQQGET